MDIKSFGCSFIFGSELADDGFGGPYATPSQLTWPALLAKHYGYGYQCHARPGSGNLQIAERVLTQINTSEPALYIIGWTWIDRFDYVNNDRWHTIMPIDETAVAKTYYRDLHSEYRDQLTTLMSMRAVIDTLTQKNLPFVMTYMDDLAFDQHPNTKPAVLELQNYVKPHMTCFEGMNFLEWSKKNGYPIGVAAHPLEEAHCAASEYMLQLLVNKV